MILEVDDSTVKKTTKCENNFSCLPEKRKELCKVTYQVDDKVYFVECQKTEPCSYVVPFGHSFVCTCPVRKEVYVRYNM